MGGCAYGADPTPGSAGLQKLLDVTSLAASVLTFFKDHRPTALAGLTASLVDINSLCALNPDPPVPLSALEVVQSAAYIASGQFAEDPNLTRWLYEWLRYQAFTQFCVCRAPTLDPAHNCTHPTNISIPSGQGQVVNLPTITLDAAVLNSWQATPNTLRTLFNAGKVTTSGSSGSVNWDFQIQYADGTWNSQINGAAFPEGSHQDFALTIQRGVSGLGTTVPCRILTNFGAAGQLASLDFCFIPLVVPAPPPPDQPAIPTLPIVPAPICSTDDLCSIVQELSRQITRLAAQVSDIQATVGGTDVLQTIRSTPISGEGELTLVSGTRAVSVELTHLGPGVYTSALGRPRGLMRAGSVRWGDGVGYSAREFIDADRFTRDRPQGALTLSWQLVNECLGIVHELV